MMEYGLPPVPKEETEKQFQKVLYEQENRKCIACPAQAREWVSLPNAVFMCLSCASQCRNIRQDIVQIKSVNLDVWNERQIRQMALGGNARFRQMIRRYDLGKLPFIEQICTKAAVAYRQSLQAKLQGIETMSQLEILDGQQIAISPENRMKQVKKQEQKDFLDTAKDSIVGAYHKTADFTSKTYHKIGDKLSSPEFKQKMSDFGDSVKEKSTIVGREIKETSKRGYEATKNAFKLGWNFISTGVQSIGKKNE